MHLKLQGVVELGKSMRKNLEFSTMVVLAAIVLVAIPAAAPLASAQSTTSGSFNPQSAFSVGSTIQISSVYGVATIHSPLARRGNSTQNGTALRNAQNGNHTAWNNSGNHTSWHSQYQNRTGFVNGNRTSARNIRSVVTSTTITVQVTNDTGGGIVWVIQTGSITVNGTTWTITSGRGGIDGMDQVLVFGNATSSTGQEFAWRLQGLATLYNGTIIVTLRGGMEELASQVSKTSGSFANGSTSANLNYVATMT